MDEYPEVAFAEYVIRQIVNKPEAVRVNRKVDELGVLLEVDVAREDMGMVIGRSGQTATALRTLVRVIGAKQKARINLKFNEPEGSTHFRSNGADKPARYEGSVDEKLGREPQEQSNETSQA